MVAFCRSHRLRFLKMMNVVVLGHSELAADSLDDVRKVFGDLYGFLELSSLAAFFISSACSDSHRREAKPSKSTYCSVPARRGTQIKKHV